MADFGNIYEALSATQENIEQPKKTAENPMFKSGYVNLDGVVAAINNAKKKAGAKFFWTNLVREGLMYTIIYGYGEKLELPGSRVADGLGNRSTNAAQAEGSALTYARRYSLSMAFGIAADVDDDGNNLQGTKLHSQKNSPNQAPLNREAQIKMFDDAVITLKQSFGQTDESIYQVIPTEFNVHNHDELVKLPDGQLVGLVKWIQQSVSAAQRGA